MLKPEQMFVRESKPPELNGQHVLAVRLQQTNVIRFDPENKEHDKEKLKEMLAAQAWTAVYGDVMEPALTELENELLLEIRDVDSCMKIRYRFAELRKRVAIPYNAIKNLKIEQR